MGELFIGEAGGNSHRLSIVTAVGHGAVIALRRPLVLQRKIHRLAQAHAVVQSLVTGCFRGLGLGPVEFPSLQLWQLHTRGEFRHLCQVVTGLCRHALEKLRNRQVVMPLQAVRQLTVALLGFRFQFHRVGEKFCKFEVSHDDTLNEAAS